MSCGLSTKLDAAVAAAREAFDLAHEKDSLTDSDLNLLFVYYQGLKKIKNGIDKFILSVSENGYGKRSSAYEYRISNRGGKGISPSVDRIALP